MKVCLLLSAIIIIGLAVIFIFSKTAPNPLSPELSSDSSVLPLLNDHDGAAIDSLGPPFSNEMFDSTIQETINTSGDILTSIRNFIIYQHQSSTVIIPQELSFSIGNSYSFTQNHEKLSSFINQFKSDGKSKEINVLFENVTFNSVIQLMDYFYLMEEITAKMNNENHTEQLKTTLSLSSSENKTLAVKITQSNVNGTPAVTVLSSDNLSRALNELAENRYVFKTEEIDDFLHDLSEYELISLLELYNKQQQKMVQSHTVRKRHKRQLNGVPSENKNFFGLALVSKIVEHLMTDENSLKLKYREWLDIKRKQKVYHHTKRIPLS